MTTEEPTAGEVPDIGASWLDLYDWRARVAQMYCARNTAMRAGEEAATVLARFRAAKNALFKTHPQSPLGPEDRASFTGLRYFDYEPSLRMEAELEPIASEEQVEAPSSGQGVMRFPRAARVRFSFDGTAYELYVYWIDVYGGGLFLPFRDATSPEETYGAGRYLFDTVKGSDFERMMGGGDTAAMGYGGGRILIDFNFSYNPSCAYDVRWVCPLAPRENWSAMSIRAGEQKYLESA